MPRADATMKHIRKGYASKGDDITLTRFVKVGNGPIPRRRYAPPAADSDFIVGGRSKFWRTAVKPVAEVANVLVSGHSNIKIGRDVRRGPLRGYWIYYLTLEERATCPSSCRHWQSCYGNNMPFGQRVDHRDPEALMLGVERDIVKLLGVRGRVGLLLRLHELGDFFSPDYVRFYDRQLRKYPRLSIYGYTAHRRGTPIGDAVAEVTKAHGARFAIRFSDSGMAKRSTVAIKSEADCPPDAFVCPEQTGKTKACATCAACWSTDKNVAFLEH